MTALLHEGMTHMDGAFHLMIGGAATPRVAPARARRRSRPVDTSGCIQLAEGQLFDPLNPDASMMTPGNLARGLAHGCRFAGQVADFYSVAQHSVLVAALAPQDHRTQRAALLHDGDEAFGLPDLASPFKHRFPDYVAAQARQARILGRIYGFGAADHARIKPADRLALVVEKAALKPAGEDDFWSAWLKGMTVPGWLVLRPLPPVRAHALFRAAYDRVFVERQPVSPRWLVTQDGFAPGAEPPPA